MKRLVAFIGSPNKNGRTATFVKEVIRGAQKNGISTKTYILNDMNIKYCQSCKYCKQEGEGCCINDDMQLIYEDFKNADAVVIGSPIYTFQVSAQTKTLFDRFYALLDASFNRRFDIKKAVMVYSQGDSNPDINKSYFETNSKFFDKFGLEIIDTIVYAGFDEVKRDELMKKAFKAGEKLIE